MVSATPLIFRSIAVLSSVAFLVGSRSLAQEAAGSDGSRTYHLGVTTVGIRHLDVVGLGFFGAYGDWDKRDRPVNIGGEAMLGHSGERRVRLKDVHNGYFLADSAGVGYVYEQVSSIALGGSMSRNLRSNPERFGLALPGISVGISGGLVIEADRVGLQSSDLDYYYGYGTPSDTNLSFRPYIRPHTMLSQGSISVLVGVFISPEFASWSVGVVYGW